MYWICTGLTQFCLINMFRSARVKAYFGVDDYLPGSELERINSKAQYSNENEQKVYTKSELRKKAREAANE